MSDNCNECVVVECVRIAGIEGNRCYCGLSAIYSELSEATEIVLFGVRLYM